MSHTGAAADLVAFRGQWFVVKIGGELAADRARLAVSVCASVRAFVEAGIRVVVVHGGGPQVTQLSGRLGLKTVQVGGRRVTDAATLEVLKMAVAGQVSIDVASAFRLAKVPALCTTGVSAGLIEAKRRPPTVITGGGAEPVDLGLVGDVTHVDVGLIHRLTDAGAVLAIGCLASDAEGTVFNINADTLATRVAARLSAAKLLLVSNVPGVLRDKDDPTTRLPTLTESQARAEISAGRIVGGMIAKVEESVAMLSEGIGAIHIVGPEPADALVREATDPGSVGTAFVR